MNTSKQLSFFDHKPPLVQVLRKYRYDLSRLRALRVGTWTINQMLVMQEAGKRTFVDLAMRKCSDRYYPVVKCSDKAARKGVEGNAIKQALLYWGGPQS